MKPRMKHLTFTACVIGVALAMLAGSTPAQQFPIPKTPAEVPGPAAGTAMTKEYVQMVGRMAYLWGWPLVDNANRAVVFSKAPEPGLVGGVVPIAHDGIAMLTDYVSPEQRFIACSNQDVVYGFGFLPLDKEPIVFQVPDFGDRFWVFALYDARTDEFSQIGKQYGTKPGFYMIVGPNWKGETPAGITAVVRSSTSLAFATPRIFMDDTAEDHKAIQPVLSQINFYPLSQFDGKMKTKDWSKLPHFPAPKSTGKGETKWVNPETFFDELPAVMKQVPPLPGEEALYKWIGSVLEAAAKDPEIKKTLKETAIAAERELIDPFFQWRNNGRPAGNGWNSPVNNAEWGTDYLNRTGTAKSNMYDNLPEETKYIYTDDDSQGKQLDGQNTYTITFAKGQTPPVKGFWSLTLYNDGTFLSRQPAEPLFAGHEEQEPQVQRGRLTDAICRRQIARQGQGKQLAAGAEGTFSLYIRCYWPEKAVLDGTWTAADDRDGEVNDTSTRRRHHAIDSFPPRCSPPRSWAVWRFARHDARAGQSHRIGSRYAELANLPFAEDYPTQETAQQLKDELLFQQATQSYLWALPAINMWAMKEGSEKVFGAGYNVLPVWKKRHRCQVAGHHAELRRDVRDGLRG